MIVPMIIVLMVFLLGRPAQAEERECRRAINVISYNLHENTWWEWAQRWSLRRQGVLDILGEGAHDLVMLQETNEVKVRDIQKALAGWKLVASDKLAIAYRETSWAPIVGPVAIACQGLDGQMLRVASLQDSSPTTLTLLNFHMKVPASVLDSTWVARNVDACLTSFHDPFQIIALSIEAEDALQLDARTWEEFLQDHDLNEGLQRDESQKTTNGWWATKWVTQGRRDMIMSRPRGLPVNLDLDRRRFRGAHPSTHFALRARVCLDADPPAATLASNKVPGRSVGHPESSKNTH